MGVLENKVVRNASYKTIAHLLCYALLATLVVPIPFSCAVQILLRYIIISIKLHSNFES